MDALRFNAYISKGDKSQAIHPSPKVLNVFGDPQLSMKFSQLINMKMPTTVGIFMFISIENITQLN